MTLPATDSFTAAADAPLTTYSANWALNVGAFGINAAGDYCYPNSLGGECAAHWAADTFSADQYAECTITNTNNDCQVGPAVRCAAAGEVYYGLYWGPNYGTPTCWMFKQFGGAWTELGSVVVSLAAGDVLRLEINGSTLTPKVNGVLMSGIGTKTDADIGSGYAGICGYSQSTDARLDNWQGGNLGGGGISGSAAITLGGLTSSGSGSVAVRGAAAVTLGGLTVTATGSVGSAAVSGAANITLGGLTIAGAGSVTVRGTGAVTLGSLTSSGAGKVTTRGAAAITLGPLTSTGAGYALTGATVGGVLTVDPTNGRYFRNGTGPLVLAGFHTWASIQDSGPSLPITPLDFDAYLAALIAYGCNFTKAWFLESAKDWGDSVQYFAPHPWARTGPGNAADGLPKFDLSQFNGAYFDRLRERVIRLGNAGIYVCVQLFQGWHVAQKGFTTGDPWAHHPFAAANNVNSIDGDTNDDGNGYETRTTTLTAAYNLQKAYVEKVLDTLNDLDNVFYEIANEEDSASLTWQRALVAHIRSYEGGKPKQHPVGMTVCWPGGDTADLYASDVDWLSPNGDYTPDAASAAAVSAFDTDHITGLTAEYKWVFRALCQGHNPWYMDEWAGETYGNDTRSNATYQRIRANLGYAVAYAARLDLAGATPQGGLSSTGYCLASATRLIAYQDASGSFTVNLATFAGVYAVEWLRSAATTPTTQSGGTVTGGAVRTLTPPWAGEDAVALLERVGAAGGAAITLGGLTVVAAGAVTVRGQAAVVLGALTAAGAGVVSVTGAAAITLGGLTVSGAGSVAVRGSAALALGALVSAGAGTVGIGGQAAITLGGLSVAASGAVGNVPVIGAAAITLGAVTVAGAGTVGIGGQAALALDALAVQATGSVAVTGAAALALGALTVAATGTSGEQAAITGSAALTLDGLTVTGAGSVTVRGTGTITLGALTVAGAGFSGELPTITGAASITLGGLTVAGVGVTAFAVVIGRVTGPGGAGMVSGPKSDSRIGV